MATEVWSGNQGALCVFVSKAKDLPNLTKIDKQNVMLRLRIAHMTRESNTLFRAGQNPVFNYLENYSITPDIRPVMQVEVYCDRRKKSPILIGRCEVDLLNGIRADPKEGYCCWYELTREKSEFAGTIFIELTFNPSLPNLHKEGTNEDTRARDLTLRSRPIPRLPGDSSPFTLTGKGSDNDGLVYSGTYMHGSAVREITPSAVENTTNHTKLSRTLHSDPVGIDIPPLPILNSSMRTDGTTSSEDTTTSEITDTSDTKFHFANLRKLRERLNVFKYPHNLSNNQESEASVDIEALQKAIGITSLDDDEENEAISVSPDGDTDDRHPSLPPLPSSGGVPVKRPSLPWHELGESPRLPELPVTIKKNRPSPKKRPPPIFD